MYFYSAAVTWYKSDEEDIRCAYPPRRCGISIIMVCVVKRSVTS